MKGLKHKTGVTAKESILAATREAEKQGGASVVEYSLLVAFIATVVFAAATALGLALVPGFQSVLAGLG